MCCNKKIIRIFATKTNHKYMLLLCTMTQTKGDVKWWATAVLMMLMVGMLPQRAWSANSDDEDDTVLIDGVTYRAIGIYQPELFEGWRMVVYSKQANETAQIRYYSAAKGGVYTILKTVTLNNLLQQENITF